MKHTIRTAAAITAGLVWVLANGAADIMDWSGGNTNWASTNWLDNGSGDPTNAWPGDATHVDDWAYLKNGGEIYIKDGDLLEPGRIFMYADSPAVIQTGGTNYANSTIYMTGGSWTLTGGLLGGPGLIRIYNGTILTQDGGKLGDRDEDTGHNFGISFQSGTATLDIKSGILRPHNIKMDQGASDALMRITGTNVDFRTIAGMDLDSGGVGKTSTVEFVFSEGGISTVVPGGGSTPNFRLGSGDTAGHLQVDVRAYKSDGNTPFALFDYGNTNKLSGAFGSVTVTDDTFGVLTEGTIGSLSPGEYGFTYTGGDGSDIVIYFNNPLPPVGTIVVIR